MRLEQLRKAYKIAENVSVDYNGMTPEEIKELDDALDTVFKLAKEAIERAEESEDMRTKEEKRYKLNVRLKSGKEFNFTCSGYNINYNELLGIVTRFEFDNGRGNCPIYINPTNIESISIDNEEVKI